MKIPKTFIKNNKKYFYIETCKNFARYQTGVGISECFSFHELGLIEEMTEPNRKQYRDGLMFY